MYCKICEQHIEEGNVCQKCIDAVNKVRERIVNTYNAEYCAYTEMRSQGNSSDVFEDGTKAGEHYAYYELGVGLRLDLPEPVEPDYDDMW